MRDIPEETRKSCMARLYFGNHLYLPGAVKNVDFCIARAEEPPRWLFWAEAKKKETPLARMLTQLILTVRKHAAPGISMPEWIGVFDCRRICFIPISVMHELAGIKAEGAAPSDSSNPKFKEFEEAVREKLYNSKSCLFELRETEKIMEFVDENILKNQAC